MEGIPDSVVATNPQGQPFGHLAPGGSVGGMSGTMGTAGTSGGTAGTSGALGNRNSVLFEGNLDGLTHGYELGQASGASGWTLDNIS